MFKKGLILATLALGFSPAFATQPAKPSFVFRGAKWAFRAATVGGTYVLFNGGHLATQGSVWTSYLLTKRNLENGVAQLSKHVDQAHETTRTFTKTHLDLMGNKLNKQFNQVSNQLNAIVDQAENYHHETQQTIHTTAQQTQAVVRDEGQKTRETVVQDGDRTRLDTQAILNKLTEQEERHKEEKRQLECVINMLGARQQAPRSPVGNTAHNLQQQDYFERCKKIGRK